MICGLKPGHYSSKHTKSIMKVNMKCEQPVEKSLGTYSMHQIVDNSMYSIDKPARSIMIVTMDHIAWTYSNLGAEETNNTFGVSKDSARTFITYTNHLSRTYSSYMLLTSRSIVTVAKSHTQ